MHTFGFGVKAARLMAGKLDIGVDLSYARSRTPIEITGGAYFGNGNTTKGDAEGATCLSFEFTYLEQVAPSASPIPL